MDPGFLVKTELPDSPEEQHLDYQGDSAWPDPSSNPLENSPNQEEMILGDEENLLTVKHEVMEEDYLVEQTDTPLPLPKSKKKGPKVKRQREKTGLTYSCSVCEKKFLYESSLEIHMRFHSGENLRQCSECGKRYATQYALKRHSRTHKKAVANVCNICNASFMDPGDFNKHKLFHLTGEPPYTCKECGDAFETYSAIKAHRSRKHREKWQCRHCWETFPTEKLYQDHRVVHETYVCPQCHAKFMTQELLDMHLEESGEHQAPPNVLPPPTATKDNQFLECNLCNKRFSRRDNLLEHRRLHTGIGLVSCEHCPMKCTTQARLRKHMKKHTARKSFPCPQCDKEFVTERYLGIHILKHTDEQLPYPCELCGKAFSRSNSLTSHMNSHMKRFPCSRCSMVFPSDRLLKIHRRTHKMMCDLCKMNFETMELLGMHYEEYHPGMDMDLPSQEEPQVAEEKQSLSCETCGKEFSRISHFKAHMNTHLKSFPCSRCSKVFPSERQLKKHSKTCQMSGDGEEDEEEKQKEPEEAVDQVASEEEPEEAEAVSEEEMEEPKKRISVKKESQGDFESWPCKLCGEDFSRKKSLEIHLRTHTINFPCKRCHLMFPSERLMKKHRKIHKTTCKICSMGFETRQLLQEHYQDVHPESKRAKVITDPLEGI